MSDYLKRSSHLVDIDAAMDNSERARRLLFATTLFALTMVILLLPVTKITLDIQIFGHASIFVAFLGAAAIYCRLRRVPGAAVTFELMACCLQLSILGLLASYMAVSVGAPEVDIQFTAMDAAIGFNGAEFVRAVDSNGLFSLLVKRSYASFQFQSFFLPCLLVLFRQGPGPTRW
ncbi:hypothetical protein AB4Z52_02960 [Rhizobium sp. 2YAF20]|uniref:hypothetical protein n=1 Tax=Rhizobium sp. 2YAF20 TaxID=3233027 RepID=UPI003F960A5B